MRKGIAALSAALVVALGLTLAGCATTPGSSQGTQGGAVIATSSVETTTSASSTATVSGALPPSESGISSQADAKAIDQQLDAMQKEIDSLSMPTDSDFGSAESALY